MDNRAFLRDIKDMILGIGIMVFSIAFLAFGYTWFQNTSGFVVCFYGGLILLVAGGGQWTAGAAAARPSRL